jgi:alpha,alpha-trehalase
MSALAVLKQDFSRGNSLAPLGRGPAMTDGRVRTSCGIIRPMVIATDVRRASRHTSQDAGAGQVRLSDVSSFCRRALCLIPVLIFLASSAAAKGQVSSDQDVKIRAYIRSGWDGLSRSMSECKSLVDPKVTKAPVLYLPAGMPVPGSVTQMQRECSVTVKHLPRAIHHIGDVRVADIADEGLLYLPNRYVVPGGRFNEMYGWDSYFIILGLLDDDRDDVARGMVENFFFEIENYGALLNANRTYFLTRSQPPLLSSMIRAVYEHRGTTPLPKTWLEHAYAMAQRDHELWTSGIHTAGSTGLARYHDIGKGPVPEMADDSSYYPDVIRWLLAHPDVKTNYLVAGAEQPTGVEAAQLAQSSCDVTASKVCEHAWVDGHRLSAGFYEGDRAMRESGFDTSFRFGPFSGSTENIAPVCLNSLLFKYEKDLAHFATLLERKSEAAKWNAQAESRRATINRLMWNEDKGLFYDYNFAAGKQTSYNYLTTFYPLWAGLATAAQAATVEKHLSIFERDGGLMMSDNDSGTQWDEPFGWAPTNWLVVAGLESYGFHEDAARIAEKFSGTVLQNFLHDGTIREKYNVMSGSANVKVAAGYKANVIGFGWTNGVYLRLHNLLTLTPDGKSVTTAQH